MTINISDDYYNNIHEEIKFFFSSEIRLKILSCLFIKPSSIKDIENNTSFNYNSILANINKLEEKGHISSKNDKYYINNCSMIKLMSILYFNKSLNFLFDNSDFLNDCIIDDSSNVLSDLSPLDGAELIYSTPTDLYKTTKIFQDFFMGSNQLKAIFPYLHPNYSIIFEYWLERNVSVDLIIPKKIVSSLTNVIKENIPKNLIKDKYFKILALEEDLHFALVVSDKGIALGFYNKDGFFDQNSIIVSKTRKSIIWGLELFKEYDKKKGEYFYLDENIY